MAKKDINRRDFTDKCLSEMSAGKSETLLRDTFCIRCQNRECSRSEFANSLWESRIRTQEGRFFEHPNFADIDDPRYEFVKKMNFKDLIDKAIMYEVSSKNMSWKIPTQQEIEEYKLAKFQKNNSDQFVPEQFIETNQTNQYEEGDGFEDSQEEDEDLDTNEEMDNEIDSQDSEIISNRMGDEMRDETESNPEDFPHPIQNNMVLRQMPKNTPIPIGGIMLSRKEDGGDSPGTSKIHGVVPPKMNWGESTKQVQVGNNLKVTLGGSGNNNGVKVVPSDPIKVVPPKTPKLVTKLIKDKPR
jgi:hypothetical protein